MQATSWRTVDKVVAVLSMVGSVYVIGWILKFFMTPREKQNLPGEVGGLILIFLAGFAVLAFLSLLASILVVREKRGAFIPLGVMLLLGALLLNLSGAVIHSFLVGAGGVYLLARYRYQSTL